MDNNNNDNDLIADTGDNGSIDFLSELLCNQSFVSDEERKGKTTTENTKHTTEINTNEHESFISDIIKDLGIEVPASQKEENKAK